MKTCDSCGEEIKEGERSYIVSQALYRFCLKCKNFNMRKRRETGNYRMTYFRGASKERGE